MWDIESEICRLAHTSDVAEALVSLNLLPSKDNLFLIRSMGDWVRAGSETYVCYFDLDIPSIGTRQLLFKACVAWSPAGSLREILQSWIQRRELLAREGVATPQLFGWGDGVILEESIPYSLKECLPNNAEAMLFELTHYASVLAKHKFAPIEAFEDLRSHGNDVVAIDFGEDLGPPNLDASFEGQELLKRLFDVVARWGIDIDEHTTHRMNQLFRAHMF
jgi:hypothetical protein